MIKIIKKIIGFIFRKKTLTGILYLLIIFVLGELAALGSTEEIIEFCDKIKSENPNGWKYYGALLIDIFFGKGSMFSLCISLGLILLISFLRYTEIVSSNSNTIDKVEKLKDSIKGMSFRVGRQNILGFEGLEEMRRHFSNPKRVSDLADISFRDGINLIQNNYNQINEILGDIEDNISKKRFKRSLAKNYKLIRKEILPHIIIQMNSYLDRYFEDRKDNEGNTIAIGWEEEVLMGVWTKTSRLKNYLNIKLDKIDYWQ
jgi:hypothetical protein